MDPKAELSRLQHDLDVLMESAVRSQKIYEVKLDYLKQNVSYFIELMSKNDQMLYTGDDDDEMNDDEMSRRYPDFVLSLDSSSNSSTSGSDTSELHEEITRDCFVALDRHAVGKYYINQTDEGLSDSNSDDVSIGKRVIKSMFPKLNSNEIERNLQALRKSDALFCRDAETFVQVLPENYLKYAAVRGWTLKEIRQHTQAVDQIIQSKESALKEIKSKSKKLKKKANNKSQKKPSLLNTTDEQYQVNLLALRQKYEANKERYKVGPLTDYYFAYGAARSYDIKHVLRKFSFDEKLAQKSNLRLKEMEPKTEKCSSKELKEKGSSLRKSQNASTNSINTERRSKRNRSGVVVG